MTPYFFHLSRQKLQLFLFCMSCVPFTDLLAHEDEQVEVGIVTFDSQCSESAQASTNRAVAQLHNMMYVEAEGIFNAAMASDPECAMLHWGVAMTNFHPLWPGITSDLEMARGRKAIDQALRLGGANARESAYINAAAKFYEGGDVTSLVNRVAAWAAAQKTVYEQFPDDVDAAAFSALSRLAVAPKGDKTFTQQQAAGALLEELHANNPEHPAGFHYLIHAYDNPILADKAEAVSHAYDKLAPSVPHALHMPSHIFVRMGLWNETIYWNERSAKAALAAATNEVTSMHYAHAMDYKVYAHLQRGETDLAVADVDEMISVANHQDGFAAAYALAAAPARLLLEAEDWDGAANLSNELHPAISWSELPAVVAIHHFAQGIGAARSGDLDKAEEIESKVELLHEALVTNGPAYWATIVASQHKSLQAWIAFAEGDNAQAETLMLAAADTEDSVGKSPVTPSAVLPARELLGDMLSLMGKHREAITAYEAALNKSPNRARSLRGALLAAQAVGDSDKLTTYQAAVENLVALPVQMKTFVVTLDKESGAHVAQSQLAAASYQVEHSPELQHGVSLLEEFRSDGVWFLSFNAADMADVQAYLTELALTPKSIIESSFINSPELAGGPKAGSTLRNGHKVFVIERDIPGAGSAPMDVRLKISEGSQGAIENIGDGIEWDHSYVTGEGTFCVYRASDPSLIQEHAHMLDIPANPITEVEHIIHDLNFPKSKI